MMQATAPSAQLPDAMTEPEPTSPPHSHSHVRAPSARQRASTAPDAHSSVAAHASSRAGEWVSTHGSGLGWAGGGNEPTGGPGCVGSGGVGGSAGRGITGADGCG